MRHGCWQSRKRGFRVPSDSNTRQSERPILTITMYGITNCDTIKKARGWLESHDVAYRFHDYRAEGLDADRLNDWVTKVGWEILLNKASMTFRELSEKDKQSLDEQKAKALMLAKPTMIKRPVLELGDCILVGFKPEVYQQAVGGLK
jgi:Spx/MgsR family transcriptional regulator